MDRGAQRATLQSMGLQIVKLAVQLRTHFWLLSQVLSLNILCVLRFIPRD